MTPNELDRIIHRKGRQRNKNNPDGWEYIINNEAFKTPREAEIYAEKLVSTYITKSKEVRMYDSEKGTYKTFDTQSDLDKHKQAKIEGIAANPTKGMTVYEKAEYNIGQQDPNWVGTVSAVADSSTVYDKTKLPQFMPSLEKQSTLNLIQSKIEALQGEIDSYVSKRKGKPDYISKSDKKAHAKAVADLKYQRAELLKFKSLKSNDPYGFFTDD